MFSCVVIFVVFLCPVFERGGAEIRLHSLTFRVRGSHESVIILVFLSLLGYVIVQISRWIRFVRNIVKYNIPYSLTLPYYIPYYTILEHVYSLTHTGTCLLSYSYWNMFTLLLILEHVYCVLSYSYWNMFLWQVYKLSRYLFAYCLLHTGHWTPDCSSSSALSQDHRSVKRKLF